MSRRMQIGATAIIALAFAGGAYVWLHGHHARPYIGDDMADDSWGVSAGENPGMLPGAPAPGNKAAAHALSSSEAKKAAAAAGAEAGFPLRAGEVLEYAAAVAKVRNVANLRLSVLGQRNIAGKNVWHLQAIAHTENPLRIVFELDDRFDSYSDAATLASLQYEMHLNERGQKVESIQRMSATGKDPAPANATRVLPGTRDPLGMMQYLRNVDWSKTPEVRSPVYDGRKLYDVRARLAGKPEAVSVAAGNFTASKIAIRVFDNGTEMKDAHFTMYLANNAARTPVLLEALLPFAMARVELTKAR